MSHTSSTARTRLVLATLTTVAALTALTASSAAVAAAPAPADAGSRAADSHLVITVAHSDTADGTYELTCAPAGGTHPEPQDACAALDEAAAEEDPFTPVPENTICTRIYGGPATAEVAGTWRGEPVRASFSRADGCEIHRWDQLTPALPEVGGERSLSGSPTEVLTGRP